MKTHKTVKYTGKTKFLKNDIMTKNQINVCIPVLVSSQGDWISSANATSTADNNWEFMKKYFSRPSAEDPFNETLKVTKKYIIKATLELPEEEPHVAYGKAIYQDYESFKQDTLNDLSLIISNKGINSSCDNEKYINACIRAKALIESQD